MEKFDRPFQSEKLCRWSNDQFWSTWPIRDRPKSPSFGTKCESSKIFALFTSPWMITFEWRYTRARAVPRAIDNRWGQLKVWTPFYKKKVWTPFYKKKVWTPFYKKKGWTPFYKKKVCTPFYKKKRLKSFLQKKRLKSFLQKKKFAKKIIKSLPSLCTKSDPPMIHFAMNW